MTDYDDRYADWDDDLTGPVREEPDDEAQAAEELAEHEDAEHGGQPCDCPRPPIEPTGRDHPSFAEEPPF